MYEGLEILIKRLSNQTYEQRNERWMKQISHAPKLSHSETEFKVFPNA